MIGLPGRYDLDREAGPEDVHVRREDGDGPEWEADESDWNGPDGAELERAYEELARVGGGTIGGGETIG